MVEHKLFKNLLIFIILFFDLINFILHEHLYFQNINFKYQILKSVKQGFY